MARSWPSIIIRKAWTTTSEGLRHDKSSQNNVRLHSTMDCLQGNHSETANVPQGLKDDVLDLACCGVPHLCCPFGNCGCGLLQHVFKQER